MNTENEVQPLSDYKPHVFYNMVVRVLREAKCVRSRIFSKEEWVASVRIRQIFLLSQNLKLIF